MVDVLTTYKLELSVLATIVVGNYIRFLGQKIRNKYLYALVFFLGTVMHELCHAAAFTVTSLISLRFPRMTFSLWPKTNPDGSWTLGSVSCAGINWFSAFPVAMAPALMLLLPVMVVEHWGNVVTEVQAFISLSESQIMALLVFSMGFISHSAFPSVQDFRVASSHFIGTFLWMVVISFVGYNYYILW